MVEANKHEWRRRLAALAEALNAPRPKQAADGLMRLVEGGYAVRQTLGGPDGPASEIVGAAEAILAAHSPSRDDLHPASRGPRGG